jgi:hypothetical protein
LSSPPARSALQAPPLKVMHNFAGDSPNPSTYFSFADSEVGVTKLQAE